MSGIKITIAVVPALLILSVCLALYLGANADKEEARLVVGEVTVSEMADYLKKVHTMIAERAVATEQGQRALRQVAAMSMGTLGPENLGYEIFQSQKDSAAGFLWPTIWIQAGDREAKDPVVLAVPQAGQGAGLAFAYGFAEYLTSHETKAGVRIVLYPPLDEGDLAAWLWERCGARGERLKGFLKVSEGKGGVVLNEMSVPASDQEFLKKLAEKKTWEGCVTLLDAASPHFELRLAGRSQDGRVAQAQHLIRVMPLVKELLEHFAQ